MDSSYFSRVAIAALIFAAVSMFASDFKIVNKVYDSLAIGVFPGISALVGAGVITSALGSVLDRLTSLVMRWIKCEPDQYPFLHELQDELSKFDDRVRNHLPSAVYNVIYYAHAPGALIAWRSRRRVQMYFNLNCILAIILGFVIGSLFLLPNPACTGAWWLVLVISSSAIWGLGYLAKIEREFDKEATKVWITFYKAELAHRTRPRFLDE